MQRAIVRSNVVVAHVGHQHAERGKMGRQVRNNHLRDVQITGDRKRVWRPTPTHGYQGKITWIVTALHRDTSHRKRHFGHCNLYDPMSHLGGTHVEGSAQLCRNALGGSLNIEGHLAPEKTCWTDSPEHNVGVGDCRLCTTAAVGDWSG